MQPDESGRVFRNHPSVIVSYLLSAAIVMVVLVFLSLREYAWDNKFETIAIVALVMLATLGWAYFFWKRTFYIFEDNEIHVTRDAVFKVDKHIQYTRLASVGVRRDLVNRLFGTSTLTFNVNSSMNSTSAEATLVLKKDIADRLRDQLNSMIFEKEVTVEQELTECQTLVHVSNADIVMHAILGQPTWQALFGLLMLFYAVVMLFADSSGGFITAVILFVLGEVLPFISVILKYYNYRIYRVGDTVTVESGLITTQRRSFKVNKINSVRIREPLLARLFRKAMLEAEVVGMADQDNNNAPVLCPLKGRKDVEEVLGRLLPELVFESSPERQPRRALIPMLITDAIATVFIVGVCLALFFTAETYLVGESETLTLAVRATELFAAVVVPILIFGRSGMAQRHRTFDTGKDSFMFVYGGYDICTEFINYDKVQFTRVTSGPLQRPFGLAQCTVNMMSSVGFKEITSGLFEPDDLERVADEVNARIADGRYDYRRYL